MPDTRILYRCPVCGSGVCRPPDVPTDGLVCCGRQMEAVT